MAPSSFTLLLLLLFLTLFTPTSVRSKPLVPSPYLSPATVLFPDYEKMTATFRIYIYAPPESFTFASVSESLFYNTLLNSSFVTQNPNEAHLFFVPFPSDSSAKHLSRLVQDLRGKFPYWDRALGADHFFLSRAGIHPTDRNVLELKKNAVQISCFPTTPGDFVPHKDITLPPPLNSSSSTPSLLALPHAPVNDTPKFLGYVRWDEESRPELLFNALKGDPEFWVDSEPSDLGEGLEKSKFCLYAYGGDVSWVGQALRSGCVPVVITDHSIPDLPLMDVLRWSEIAVFVGTGGGVRELKAVLSGIDGERYERMRNLGVTAGRHFVWNDSSPQPFDAFHMVMYQLWLRRHTIRYAKRESF